MTNRSLLELSKEELVEYIGDLAKNWLAHDGLWFQAVEDHHGLEHAIQLDTEAWERFTIIEAKRIKKRFDIPEKGGIEGLKKALQYRFYANINEQETVQIDDQTIEFRMIDCRVQSARKRKGLPDFPCKSVGLVEYTNFASTIDSAFETECVYCPPDSHPDSDWCKWRFTLRE